MQMESHQGPGEDTVIDLVTPTPSPASSSARSGARSPGQPASSLDEHNSSYSGPDARGSLKSPQPGSGDGDSGSQNGGECDRPSEPESESMPPRLHRRHSGRASHLIDSASESWSEGEARGVSAENEGSQEPSQHKHGVGARSLGEGNARPQEPSAAAGSPQGDLAAPLARRGSVAQHAPTIQRAENQAWWQVLSSQLQKVVERVKRITAEERRRNDGSEDWDFDVFKEQVDTQIITDYRSFVAPESEMWLDCIKDKIKQLEYSSLKELLADVEQIVANCRAYNSSTGGRYRAPELIARAERLANEYKMAAKSRHRCEAIEAAETALCNPDCQPPPGMAVETETTGLISGLVKSLGKPDGFVAVQAICPAHGAKRLDRVGYLADYFDEHHTCRQAWGQYGRREWESKRDHEDRLLDTFNFSRIGLHTVLQECQSRESSPALALEDVPKRRPSARAKKRRRMEEDETVPRYRMACPKLDAVYLTGSPFEVPSEPIAWPTKRHPSNKTSPEHAPAPSTPTKPNDTPPRQSKASTPATTRAALPVVRPKRKASRPPRPKGSGWRPADPPKAADPSPSPSPGSGDKQSQQNGKRQRVQAKTPRSPAMGVASDVPLDPAAGPAALPPTAQPNLSPIICPAPLPQQVPQPAAVAQEAAGAFSDKPLDGTIPAQNPPLALQPKPPIPVLQPWPGATAPQPGPPPTSGTALPAPRASLLPGCSFPSAASVPMPQLAGGPAAPSAASRDPRKPGPLSADPATSTASGAKVLGKSMGVWASSLASMPASRLASMAKTLTAAPQQSTNPQKQTPAPNPPQAPVQHGAAQADDQSIEYRVLQRLFLETSKDLGASNHEALEVKKQLAESKEETKAAQAEAERKALALKQLRQEKEDMEAVLEGLLNEKDIELNKKDKEITLLKKEKALADKKLERLEQQARL